MSRAHYSLLSEWSQSSFRLQLQKGLGHTTTLLNLSLGSLPNIKVSLSIFSIRERLEQNYLVPNKTQFNFRKHRYLRISTNANMLNYGRCCTYARIYFDARRGSAYYRAAVQNPLAKMFIFGDLVTYKFAVS
jgi:hypothetical protein